MRHEKPSGIPALISEHDLIEQCKTEQAITRPNSDKIDRKDIFLLFFCPSHDTPSVGSGLRDRMKMDDWQCAVQIPGWHFKKLRGS